MCWWSVTIQQSDELGYSLRVSSINRHLYSTGLLPESAHFCRNSIHFNDNSAHFFNHSAEFTTNSADATILVFSGNQKHQIKKEQ